MNENTKIEYKFSKVYDEEVDNGECVAEVFYDSVLIGNFEHTDLMGGVDEITIKNIDALRLLLLEVSELAPLEYGNVEAKIKGNKILMINEGTDFAIIEGDKISILDEDCLANAIMVIASYFLNK